MTMNFKIRSTNILHIKNKSKYITPGGSPTLRILKYRIFPSIMNGFYAI